MKNASTPTLRTFAAIAITPADIAPTLAALYGVTVPRAEGHALRAARR
jgi:hypothetical protein